MPSIYPSVSPTSPSVLLKNPQISSNYHSLTSRHKHSFATPSPLSVHHSPVSFPRGVSHSQIQTFQGAHTGKTIPHAAIFSDRDCL